MNKLDVERVYRHGFQPADFAVLQPGQLLLSPIRKPSMTAGGLHLAPTDERFDIMLWRVEAIGECLPWPQPEPFGVNSLGIVPGDVISTRTAFCEPIQANRGLWVVDVMYAFAIVQRAADAAAQAEAEAREAAEAAEQERLAKEEIARTRAELVARQS